MPKEEGEKKETLEELKASNASSKENPHYHINAMWSHRQRQNTRGVMAGATRNE